MIKRWRKGIAIAAISVFLLVFFSVWLLENRNIHIFLGDMKLLRWGMYAVIPLSLLGVYRNIKALFSKDRAGKIVGIILGLLGHGVWFTLLVVDGFYYNPPSRYVLLQSPNSDKAIIVLEEYSDKYFTSFTFYETADRIIAHQRATGYVNRAYNPFAQGDYQIEWRENGARLSFPEEEGSTVNTVVEIFWGVKFNSHEKSPPGTNGGVVSDGNSMVYYAQTRRLPSLRLGKTAVRFFTTEFMVCQRDAGAPVKASRLPCIYDILNNT